MNNYDYRIRTCVSRYANVLPLDEDMLDISIGFEPYVSRLETTGIEPATRRFSVFCSTTELRLLM